MTNRPTLVVLIVAVFLAVMTPMALAQFKRMSYLATQTGDRNGAPPSELFSIGEDRVGFKFTSSRDYYTDSFYVADATPQGTKEIANIYGAPMLGPLNYVYYSTGATWYYFDPATNFSKGFYSSEPGHYTFVFSELISSSVKNYIAGTIYVGGRLLSYNPTANNGAGEVVTERTYPAPYSPLPKGYVIYKDNLTLQADLNPPDLANAGTGEPSNLYVAPHLGYIYFGYTRNSSKTNQTTGHELWRTNLRSYKLVADINAGAGSSNPRFFCEVPEVGLFFFANPTKNATKLTLYWSDGNSKFKRMSRHETTATVPIVRVGSRAVFIVNDTTGFNLWSTDGTAAGTTRLMTVAGADLVTTQSLAFFLATTEQYGTELYQTDGTSEGTSRVPFETVSGPGSSSIQGLTSSSTGDVLFSALTSDGKRDVFKYTPAA